MSDVLEEYPGPDQELTQRLLTRALVHGGDMAEVFVEERQSLALRLEDRKIEQAASGGDRGGSMRLTAGTSTVFGYVDSVDESPLLSLAAELSRSRSATSTRVSAPSMGRSASGGAVLTDPRDIATSAKARLLHMADDTARALSKEIRQVIVAYGETRQRVWIANSRGVLAADDRTRVMLGVTVMAQRGEVIQSGHDTVAHHGGFELVSEQAVTTLATSVGRRALTLLDGRPAPTGRLPVVLGNGFGGVLFHEACGHGLEADYVLKNSSAWEGKLGQRVAGKHLFAYDDGVSSGMWGSAGCDDEGTPCQRTTLIEAGVLGGYLTDRLRAAALELPLTGNGRRQDYRHLPYPRMTNTYFKPGTAKPAELIADTAKGLYAISLSGGQVNPATGEFVFGVSEGYLIERGKIGAPVRGATLIGNGADILMGIDAVADDLAVKAGMCGKEGQHVPVGSGQPTVRIRELTIGGTGL